MNESYWISSTEWKKYEALEDDIKTDYLIIGGGIAGLTCFYLLTKHGLEVTLINADRVGYGCTGRSTGKITSQHGLVYNNIESKFGLERARQYYDINQKALELVENIIEQYHIDCGFSRVPACMYTQDEGYAKKIEKEYETYRKLELDCSLVKELSLPIDIINALVLNKQAQFHPKKYTDALAGQCVRQKGIIYEETRVTDFKPGKPSVVKTGKGPVITAEHVVITTQFPCYDGMGFYFAKLKPVRTYAVMAPMDKDFPKAHFINAESPTRSLRYVEEEKSLLIVGESHKVGHNTEDHYAALKKFGKELYGLHNYQYQWSAQDYVPPHQIPFVGWLNKDFHNIYVATGFHKWGNSNGTAAGIVISNMIINGNSPYEALYDHSTLTDVVSASFATVNADVVVQLIGGKLKKGDKEIPDESGVGRVVNMNGKRCGYYRDDDGNVYILDTTCTHVGCELKWNDLEKSWDCPCHGSRFDYKGNVLNGPAETPLKRCIDEKNKINPQIR